MNAIILAVLVMLILAMLRVHVVLSLFVGALAGGLSAGLGVSRTMVAFQDGLADGAQIALSYALLGAFAMAVAHSGLPQLLANWLIGRIENDDESASRKAVRTTTMLVLGGLTTMAIMSESLIPVHIAFIPLVVPPLLIVMSRLQLDRRAVACAITFGLVTTYMFLPLGFGRVFLYNTLYRNIKEAGLDVSQVSATQAMGIPALGMVAGLLIAVFVTYRKPRVYQVDAGSGVGSGEEVSGSVEVDRHKIRVALVAVVACFAVQAFLTWTKSEADPLLVGALTGLLLFMATRVVTIAEADDVFTGGMRMMALHRAHHDHGAGLRQGPQGDQADRAAGEVGDLLVRGLQARRRLRHAARGPHRDDGHRLVLLHPADHLGDLCAAVRVPGLLAGRHGLPHRDRWGAGGCRLTGVGLHAGSHGGAQR